MLEDPSTGLAMYRTGQIDCGPAAWWAVRQEDLEAVKKSHPQLAYQDFLSNVTHGIYMRTDMPPLNDVRIRRAISHAIDRQAVVDAVYGEESPAAISVACRVVSNHRPARRWGDILSIQSAGGPASAGRGWFSSGSKMPLHATGGYGLTSSTPCS